MRRVEADEGAEGRAGKVAEYRWWPDRLDGEEGPDVLRYPGLYDIVEPNDNTEGDIESFDMDQREPSAACVSGSTSRSLPGRGRLRCAGTGGWAGVVVQDPAK
jgi:hypothetical protein